MNRKKYMEEISHFIQMKGQDEHFRGISYNFVKLTGKYKYTYNFSWLGRPIIQFPQDIIAMQEIIW